jgi:hypothetical protein
MPGHGSVEIRLVSGHLRNDVRTSGGQSADRMPVSTPFHLPRCAAAPDSVRTSGCCPDSRGQYPGQADTAFLLSGFCPRECPPTPP